MSFKVFIYYCALCGGWAAFLAWAVSQLLELGKQEPITRSAAMAGVLGFFVAAALGLMDALLNSVGAQRVLRVLVCAVLGLLGGALGGLLGGLIDHFVKIPFLVFVGWILVGTLVGGSIGVFDVFRALLTGEDSRAPRKKLRNGLVGGFLGGLLGGLSFAYIYSHQDLIARIPNGSVTLGLVLLGVCIGLMIGLAQVVLKQAWLHVKEGFRAGRELLLTKDETTIGRAEDCDLGLFGDPTIAKVHARIVLEDNRYRIAHAADDGETLVNDHPVSSQPQPLKNGDLIRVGRSLLRFGEREKRRR